MTEPDVRREALLILRDTLRSRLEALFAQLGNDDVEMLRDRELLQEHEGLSDFPLHDPSKTLRLLASTPNYRQLIFPKPPDDHVRQRINSARNMRHDWAHFLKSNERQQRQQLHAVRWLLEHANDKAALDKFDAILESWSSASDASRFEDLSGEINRRASEVAQDERKLHERQQEADQRDASLNAREAAIGEQTKSLNERQQLIESDEARLDQRRLDVEEREQAAQRAPAPDDLRRQELAVRADEAVVAQLRRQYEEALSEQRRRGDEIARRERELDRRDEDIASREAETNQLNVAAAELSERVMDAVKRLEQLGRRQQQIATAAPAPNAPQTGVKGDLRPCRRTGCGGRMIPRKLARGPFLGCNNFPTCRYTEVMVDGAAPPQDFGGCPECDNPLVLRPGYSGPFLGCANYPQCTYNETLDKAAEDNWLARLGDRYTLERR